MNPRQCSTDAFQPGPLSEGAQGLGYRQPPGLLVSIRSLEEAAIAASLPVSILDLKEPQRGSLGACSSELWWSVLKATPFTGRWSLALGEALHGFADLEELPPGVSFVKVGPAGIDSREHLAKSWDRIQKRLCGETSLVAVAYADHSAAVTMPAEEILQLAVEFRLRYLLIDTATKGTKTSLDWLGLPRLRTLIAKATEQGVEVVLAGSLSRASLPSLEELPLAYLAVRGGVCDGGREGTLSHRKVKEWLDALAKWPERTLERRSVSDEEGKFVGLPNELSD